MPREARRYHQAVSATAAANIQSAAAAFVKLLAGTPCTAGARGRAVDHDRRPARSLRRRPAGLVRNTRAAPGWRMDVPHHVTRTRVSTMIRADILDVPRDAVAEHQRNLFDPGARAGEPANRLQHEAVTVGTRVPTPMLWRDRDR